MPVGDPYECAHCGDTWVWGEDGRDEYCVQCFNPHHESGKTKGLQTNLEVTVIEDFGRVLDQAMESEIRRIEQRKRR